MSGKDYTTSFTVEQDPAAVFDAITDVRGWWTGEVIGGTGRVGDEFDYRYEEIHYSKQKVTELIPGARVAWKVLDARLSFAGNPAEWAGTEISFDIARKGDQTEVRFTHAGLVPDFECYEACSSGWGFFINESLRRLITTGDGPMAPPWV